MGFRRMKLIIKGALNKKTPPRFFFQNNTKLALSEKVGRKKKSGKKKQMGIRDSKDFLNVFFSERNSAKRVK